MYFDRTNWKLFIPDNSPLTCRMIDDIIVDASNIIWLATGMYQGKGGLVRLKGDEWTFYTKDNSIMAYNAISKLALDKDMNIWSAVNYRYNRLPMDSLRAFLIKYDGNTFSKHNPWLGGSVSNDVTAIEFDRKGKLWVASCGNLFFTYSLSCFDGVNWQRFTPDNCGFPNVYITDMQVDEENNLWICTNSGLITLSIADSLHNDIKKRKIILHNNNTLISEQLIYNIRGQRVRKFELMGKGLYIYREFQKGPVKLGLLISSP